MAGKMPSKSNLKREAPTAQQRDKKRVKLSDTSRILSQTSNKALNKKGEIDVGGYVGALQFEIRALEQNVKNSKHGLSTRAFQQVPRELRRRTASHNVKKVPKRLQKRAAKEVWAVL